jgi:hypothetical protein
MNYKRKRCRLAARRSNPGNSYLRARLGMRPVNNHYPRRDNCATDAEYGAAVLAWRKAWDDYPWFWAMSNYPAHWDRTYHTRPRRVKNRRACRAILAGADPDNMVYPLDKKPHIYYW